ncbi:MAG: GspH/FimT family pseudopilin [Steroidobacter sp.]
MKSTSLPSFSAAKSAGFTLVELMITIVIFAILAAIAIPSFTSTIRNNEIVTDTSNLMSSLNEARSEAGKRSINVSACASADGKTCSGSATWSNGWIVFTDADKDGVAGTFDGDDKLLRTISITSGTAITSTSGDSYVRFKSTGEIANTSKVSFEITKTGCGSQEARNLTVQLTGLAAITKDDC